MIARAWRVGSATAALTMVVTVGSAGPASAAGEVPGQGVGTHRLESLRWDGSPTLESSVEASASGRGRFLAFASYDNQLVEGESIGGKQIYVRDVTTGTTQLVSSALGGGGGAGDSYDPMISKDGARITYWSTASNLVPGDTNGAADVFLFDATTGQTTLVSRTPAGRPGNGSSVSPSISADGGLVAFESAAQNLVPGVDGPKRDVFLFDTRTTTMTVLSVTPDGGPADGDSQRPSISASGRFVSFASSGRLVGREADVYSDIFVRDVTRGRTSLVSRSSSGTIGDSISDFPSISPDGRYVAFETYSENLGYQDGNGWRDVYVRDRKSRTTRLASTTPAGRTGDDESIKPSVASDGTVYFESHASDLVDGDENDRYDIFAFDNATGDVTKITFDRRGGDTNGNSSRPALTWSGNRLVYDSAATDIRKDIDYPDYDVFVYRIS